MLHSPLLAVLLKGHLWIERSLEATLRFRLAHPDKVLTTRLQFEAKLRWCHALGAIDEATYSSLASINSLRNRVAHRVDFSPEASDVAAVVGTLPANSLTIYEIMMEDSESIKIDDPTIRSLVACIHSLLIILEYAQMVHAWESEHNNAIITHGIIRAIHERLGKSSEEAERLANDSNPVPPRPDPRTIWADYVPEPLS